MSLTTQPKDIIRYIYTFSDFRSLLSLEQTATLFGDVKDHITDITINKGYIEVEGLSKLLSRVKSLKVLVLSNLEIHDDELCDMFKYFDPSKLITLDLSHNEITDNGVMFKYFKTRSMSSLETLNLSHNRLTIFGVSRLELVWTKTLKVVDLSYNCISEDAAEDYLKMYGKYCNFTIDMNGDGSGRGYVGRRGIRGRSGDPGTKGPIDMTDTLSILEVASQNTAEHNNGCIIM